MTIIVYSIGKKFLPAAECPISSVTAPNAKRLIEPAFAFKNDDKVLKYFFCTISQRLISGCHFPYFVLLVIHICQEK